MGDFKRPEPNATRAELWKCIGHFEDQIEPLAAIIMTRFPKALIGEGAIGTAVQILTEFSKYQDDPASELNENGTYGEGSDYPGDGDA